MSFFQSSCVLMYCGGLKGISSWSREQCFLILKYNLIVSRGFIRDCNFNENITAFQLSMLYWVTWLFIFLLTHLSPPLFFRRTTFSEWLYGLVRGQNSNDIFEVPENHEHWYKFYLCQLLFKSVNIYVKNWCKRAISMYIFIHMTEQNMY